MSEAYASRSVVDKLRNLLTLLEQPSTLPDEPAAQEPGVATARFSLIGLDEVRERLGGRWPALSAQVHRLAESVITSHLNPGDVFEEQGETGYVVLFAQLNKSDADSKCRVIAKEITRRLLGSEWQSLATIEATSAQVTRAALDLDDLDRALSEAFDQGERVVTSEVDGHERGLIQERECPPVNGWTTSDDQRERRAFQLEFGQAWAGSDAGASEHDLATEQQIASDCAHRISWRYLPIWDFKQRAVFYFRIVAAGEQRRLIERARGRREDVAEETLFECDLRSLKRAVADLVRLSAVQRRLPLVSTVHVSSLAHEGRRLEFLAVMREQSPEIRRLLHLSLTAPPDLPDTRSISDFVEKVRGMKVGLALTMPVDRARALTNLERSFKAVTADVGGRCASEAERMRLLDRFAGHADKAKIDGHAMGLNSRSMILSAVGAGFRYLSGPAIHPATEYLGQATRLDLGHLYETLYTGTAA